MMRASLQCRTGELSGKTHSLSTETVIGRGDGSHLVISSDLISAQHARIRQDARGFLLEDLGSSNGTWLDGERVVQPVRLDHLNVITLARAIDLIFHATTDAPAPRPAPTPVGAVPVPVPAAIPTAKPAAKPTAIPAAIPTAKPAAKPAAKPVAPPVAEAEGTQLLGNAFDILPALDGNSATPPASASEETLEISGLTRGMVGLPANPPDQEATHGERTVHMDHVFDLPPLEATIPTAAPVAIYCLVINGEGLATKTVELTMRQKYTIGRSSQCDISLDADQVSRHHATLTVGDVVLLEDAGSSNGTLIDGQRLQRPTEIQPGARFTLGPSISVQLTRG